MAYVDPKDLPRRTASGKVLRDIAFYIAKNPKYYGYQKGNTLILSNFFAKKSALLTNKSDCGGGTKNKNMSHQELTKELHKPIIRKSEKRQVHSSFFDNF